MTKKSSARLARDYQEKKHAEQLKGNTCWDDLEQMYVSMITLLTSHTNISQFAADKELIGAVVDKQTLTANLRILGQDLGAMNTELSQIHNQHIGKRGGSTDPDVVFSTIAIFEQYSLFMERHDAVVMPTVYHIIEQFNQAEQLLNATKRVNADLKDPNVISDAIVVEETKIAHVATDDGILTDANTVLPNIGPSVASDSEIPAVHESVTKPDFNKLAESFKATHPGIVMPEQPA